MAKARSIQAGDETAGVRLEFVRSRRVLRLGGWHAGNRRIEPLEVPVDRVLRALGLTAGDLGAGGVYLLMAGVRDWRTGTLRHVRAAYSSELEARHAFRRLREAHRAADEWAEVVVVEPGCRMNRLCWFGDPSRQADVMPDAVTARGR